MPVAIVRLDERANRTINIVKAKYGLKDKSQAINKLVMEYEYQVLEPELRPDYKDKLKRIKKEKTLVIKDVDKYFKEIQKR